jgi:hypothetical protein
MLIRKRPSSNYKDTKYDAVFMLTSLSDDEDHPDNMIGQPQRFLPRPPGWQSEDVSVHILYIVNMNAQLIALSPLHGTSLAYQEQLALPQCPTPILPGIYLVLSAGAEALCFVLKKCFHQV